MNPWNRGSFGVISASKLETKMNMRKQAYLTQPNEKDGTPMKNK